MIANNKTYVTWNPRNKKHYTDLGYEFSKMGSQFEVNVNDLTCGSQADIELKCDYCGKIFTMAWCTYVRIHRKEVVHKDACSLCAEKKALESINEKYGGYKELYKESNDKRTKTNLIKFGSENPFSNDTIKQKIVSSNLKKYGVRYSQQNSEVRNKTRKTCLEKYGVENYVELFKGKHIKDNSPVWKGGVEHSRKERATYEYNEWRKSIFSRDHYTCKLCGAQNGNGKTVELHAHHIFNWKDNLNLRYNIDNGITLCDKCHYDFHSKYGKKNNDLDQLKEFFMDKDKKVC